MSKKIFAIIFILPTIFFSGCFNLGTSDSNNTNQEQDSTLTKTYNNNQFSLVYPTTWDLIEPKDFSSDIPHETQLIIRNNLKNDNFTANLNVVKNDLQVNKTTLDYAKEILNRQKTGLFDYKETKREILNIQIGGQATETYYTEFEARLNQTDPILKFIQTYAVKDKNGYIILGSYLPQENSAIVDKIKNTVNSFKIN